MTTTAADAAPAPEHTDGELAAATAVGLRWISLARVVTEILLMASMVVLARLIPPSAFGMFAVAIIVQELAFNVPSEGVGSAIVQRREVTRAHLEGGLALALVTGVALAGITLVLCALIVAPVLGSGTAGLVAMSSPLFVLGAVMAPCTAVLRRRLDFRRLSMLGLAQSIVRSVTSVALAAACGLDGAALVLGGVAGMVAMVVLGVVFTRVPAPRWRRAAIRDLLPYGVPAGIACFAWAGFRNGDYAVVSARLGAAQAGLYWRGFQLAVEYQGKVTTVMSQIAFPVLTRTPDPDTLFALRRRMVRVATATVFPALALLVVLAPVVVPWLFGAQWTAAVVPAQVLAAAGAATVVIDSIGACLQAQGRARDLLGYGIAHMVVYVAAVFVAAAHGLAAVSATAAGVHVVFVVVAYRLLLRGRRERTLRVIWDDVSASLVGCGALVAVAWPASALVAGTPAVVHMALVATAGALAYLAVLRLWFPDAWGDLRAVARRVAPERIVRLAAEPRRVLRRRPSLAAGRSS